MSGSLPYVFLNLSFSHLYRQLREKKHHKYITRVGLQGEGLFWSKVELIKSWCDWYLSACGLKVLFQKLVSWAESVRKYITVLQAGINSVESTLNAYAAAVSLEETLSGFPGLLENAVI